MEIISVLFIAILDTSMVHAYYINKNSCRACSNRSDSAYCQPEENTVNLKDQVDVPCYIQELEYHCVHDEFRGIWPGLPRNLTSRKVPVGNGESAANFTWNAPYDASYQTLNGFLLRVNIAQDYNIPGLHRLQELPRCFFANLSGTNWDSVPKPHSVLFHFDCVTARATEILEVSLTLKSSPVPGEKSLESVSAVITLQQVEPIYQEPDLMTINFTVVSSRVQVKFGPVKPNTTYRVCLSPVSYEYKCYTDTITQEGQDFVVFKNVEADTYRIYVQQGHNPDNPMYTSKPFNVTETPSSPAQSPIPPSVVAIITVGCLLFVAGATTLCFCLMRERCHCLPQTVICAKCRCFQYHPASQSVPNNTHEEENDSVLEILPLYYDESEQFTLAVQNLCVYLRKWSNCRVNPDWTCDFNSNPDTSLHEKHPNGVLLIVLSCKMWKLLNQVFHSDNQAQTDLKSKLFGKILMETNGKPNSQFIICLRPWLETGKHLNGIEVFTMTKSGTGQNQNILYMNTEELYLMLKRLNDEGTVQPGWSVYEEVAFIHNAIRSVPESDLYIGQDILSSYNPTLNLPSENQEDIRVRQSGVCPFCHNRHCESMCPVRQRQEQTCRWASGCPNPYNQSVVVPPSVCYPGDGVIHDQSMSHDVDTDVESASVCQDDTESVTWSVLEQRQMEMYRRYQMASVNDTKI